MHEMATAAARDRRIMNTLGGVSAPKHSVGLATLQRIVESLLCRSTSRCRSRSTKLRTHTARNAARTVLLCSAVESGRTGVSQEDSWEPLREIRHAPGTCPVAVHKDTVGGRTGPIDASDALPFWRILALFQTVSFRSFVDPCLTIAPMRPGEAARGRDPTDRTTIGVLVATWIARASAPA